MKREISKRNGRTIREEGGKSRVQYQSQVTSIKWCLEIKQVDNYKDCMKWERSLIKYSVKKNRK